MTEIKNEKQEAVLNCQNCAFWRILERDSLGPKSGSCRGPHRGSTNYTYHDRHGRPQTVRLVMPITNFDTTCLFHSRRPDPMREPGSGVIAKAKWMRRQRNEKSLPVKNDKE